jgi:putative ATP-dependent endonuclease of the OLD family
VIIRQLDIENFRGIKSLSLALDETTVIFGSNNTGKSTIMAAIHSVLSRAFGRKGGIFSEYDYHLSGQTQPTDAPPIKITVTFSETAEGEWPDAKVQQLDKIVGLTAEGLQVVTLRVTGAYDDAINSFVTSSEFLDPTGNPYPPNTNALRKLQQLIPAFYLAALRDAAKEFRAGAPFWGPFVKALKIDPEVRAQIEQDIAALNQQVLEAHTGFESVKSRLAKSGKMVPLGGGAEPVSIEALPNRVFDILSKTQVMLSGTSGAALPLSQHGEGTQSLAVICLFDAFLDAQLIGEFGEGAVPILTLEEPEAHLHPAAVRAVGQMLSGFVGQKLISTHSGDLLASVSLNSLRRLRRVGDEVKVFSIEQGALTEKELLRLEHHVTRHRGGLLFAKIWIIVEGETDELAIQEAARILGFDLFGLGICCFETNIGYAPFIKLADQLGIHWIATADGDPDGTRYVNTARGFLNGRVEANHIRQVPAWDIENYLCHSGFGQLYLQSMSPQKLQNNPLPNIQDAAAYWKQVIKNQGYLDGKPAHMLSVFEEIEKLGVAGVPPYLREIVELAVAKGGEGD